MKFHPYAGWLTQPKGQPLGAIFSGPPKPPKPPPPPPPPPKLPDGGVQQAGADQRARALAAAGAGSTIATSPQGILVPPSTTNNKTLLGS